MERRTPSTMATTSARSATGTVNLSSVLPAAQSYRGLRGRSLGFGLFALKRSCIARATPTVPTILRSKRLESEK